jgi:hypothetical protein
VQELPISESTNVTGNAGLGGGFLSGKIYNGTGWTVTEIIFNVTAKENNGNVRWTRDIAHKVEIGPLTTDSFFAPITGDEGVTNFVWGIKQVFGYKTDQPGVRKASPIWE